MFKKLLKKEKVTLQKYKPFFVTVDGVRHEGQECRWVIKESLRIRSVPEYIMCYVKDDGYIKDKNDIMYPLTSVVSIEWELMNLKIVEDNFEMYQVWVRDDEVN